jgi:hypothetical protein
MKNEQNNENSKIEEFVHLPNREDHVLSGHHPAETSIKQAQTFLHWHLDSESHLLSPLFHPSISTFLLPP